MDYLYYNDCFDNKFIKVFCILDLQKEDEKMSLDINKINKVMDFFKNYSKNLEIFGKCMGDEPVPSADTQSLTNN